MKKIEYKTFGFEVKEAEETENKNEGVIEGYASTFGNMDQGFDVVEKGAFKATLKLNKGRVPILADHDPHSQIGWNVDAKEDSEGLLVRGAIMLDVQKGREKYALAKKALEIKAPAGISIGFTTIKAEPDADNTRIRRIKEVKLWEYSLVTFPMNTEAMVTAAKSIGQFDKAQFILAQLKNLGISLKDLELALQKEAAESDLDPTKISQSLDNLMKKFELPGVETK